MAQTGGPNGVVADWFKLLAVSKSGTNKPILSNALIALTHAEEFRGGIGFDALKSETTILKPLPWAPYAHTPRAWTDNDDRRLAVWLQGHQIYVGPSVAADAVQSFAEEHRYHPVMNYLSELSWDGVPRCDEWTVLYLGTPDTSYVRAVAVKWLISAVARIYQPGVKADCALVLEGAQGIGKSSALRALGKPWFTDEIAALGTKDAAEQLNGMWLIELAELDAVSRAADISAVKSFMSRQVDHYRAAYGRRVQDYPRQCVFAATINGDTWNRDESGARRWWPIRCGNTDLDGLERARDQLWAEARDRYLSAERWWIDDPELTVVAAEEQEARSAEDPWLEKVRRSTAVVSSISTAEILADLGVPTERQDRSAATRVGIAMRKLDFERRRVRQGDSMVWRYMRKGAI